MAKKPTYEELLARHEKQQDYQKIQAAKLQLQAKWARQNECPITTEHAKVWAGMEETEKDKTSIKDLIDMVKKKEGTEAHDEQEPGAQVAQ
jgi:hypothetical protein